MTDTEPTQETQAQDEVGQTRETTTQQTTEVEQPQESL